MNGNCVLVPDEVVRRVGIIDPVYHHSWGDIDLGYRVTDAGLDLVVTGQPVATCAFNPRGTNGYHDPELSLRERLRFANSVRGLNGRDWYTVARRHAGVLWPLAWASPYVMLVVVWARQRLGLTVTPATNPR